MTILQFNTTVHFGHGKRSILAAEISRLGMRRPFIVTDRGVVAAGVLARATESLSGPGVIFDATPPNPTEAAAEAGLIAWRDGGCDGIVAIGGGAALDLAKAIAVLAGDPAPLWEYCNRHARPRPIVNPPPLIAMPTTAGSGSEVGRSAVVIFRNGIKAGIGCPTIVRLAICDPDLTLSLPAGMTAATGMDALSHCVETFCSVTVNPPADAIVLDGLERLVANIERATAHPDDGQARWQMMMGALEGAIGFQKGMGAVHALSHPLGALGHHHGTLNAILLPHVMAYNAASLGTKLPKLRRAMGLPAEADIPGALLALNRRLRLPVSLRELGFEAARIPSIARQALEDNAHKTNPRPLDASDYEAVLAAAL